ncbi:PqqD family protein [Zavarzinia sp. CC-PAN008]|uniref:PqqD family protein n=1 Tax=Zavarzinia sp. CC-PAN008 TaxID=3243332 RepID=UPI003F7476CE
MSGAPTARFRRGAEVVEAEIRGELVLLNLVDDSYFSLDPIGARVWALLEEPRSVDELCAVLTQEYEVGLDVALRQVGAMVARMADDGLVEPVA